MSEAERQLKVAQQAIEVALDWLDRANQTIRRESGNRRSATRPATDNQALKTECADAQRKTPARRG